MSPLEFFRQDRENVKGIFQFWLVWDSYQKVHRFIHQWARAYPQILDDPEADTEQRIWNAKSLEGSRSQESLL